MTLHPRRSTSEAGSSRLCPGTDTFRNRLCCPAKTRLRTATEGIYPRTRLDGKLFNMFRLRFNSKVQLKCLRDFLFASKTHDVSVMRDACQDFELFISLNKIQVMGQEVDSPPDIRMSTHQLEVLDDFVYLGSTIWRSFSLDIELSRRIGKASSTMRRLTKRVWCNSKPS